MAAAATTHKVQQPMELNNNDVNKVCLEQQQQQQQQAAIQQQPLIMGNQPVMILLPANFLNGTQGLQQPTVVTLPQLNSNGTSSVITLPTTVSG